MSPRPEGKPNLPTCFPSAPVLAVDGQFGFRGNPETMARVADNVRSVVIPNAGHWVAEEQPAALLAEVIPFLAG